MSGSRSGAPTPTGTLEHNIARILGLGTLASVLLVALGALLLVTAGKTPTLDRGPLFDAARLVPDVLALRPEGILWLAILLSLVLPTARVAVTLLAFVRRRETRYAAVSLAVLVVLAVSALAAILTR